MTDEAWKALEAVVGPLVDEDEWEATPAVVKKIIRLLHADVRERDQIIESSVAVTKYQDNVLAAQEPVIVAVRRMIIMPAGAEKIAAYRDLVGIFANFEALLKLIEAHETVKP